MSQRLRILHVMLFVGFWMILGWVFHLSVYPYLLIGIPLCIAFQKLVRRQPLSSCWVRDHVAVRVDRLTILITLALLIVPVTATLVAWPKAGWSLRIYFLCSMVGAFAGAFALRHFTRLAMRSLLLCLATAGAFNCGLIVLAAFARYFLKHESLDISPHVVRRLGEQFFVLFPICFMVEEVAFRGILDSHIHQPGDSRSWLAGNSWFTSALVSIFWGWWHLPLFPPAHGPSQMIAMIFLGPLLSLVPGIAFSLFWRRTGNLAVPAFVHAFLDAVRNTFLGLPTV